MSHIVIVGCGIIGAAIAYELSHIPSFNITVLDRQPPAQDSTGAALGVLMGAISHKTKGRAWRLRETSLRRYGTLIPELEAQIGDRIPVNRDGIVMLLTDQDDLGKWQWLIELRQSQGWPLHRWDKSQLGDRCPYIGDQLDQQAIAGAVYSPQDLQIHPTALTHALVSAAQTNGVIFRFNAEVQPLESSTNSGETQTCQYVRYLESPPNLPRRSSKTQSTREIPADWVIIAAGLGSSMLSQCAPQPVDIRPVLGQAVRLRVKQPLPNSQFQPVISGHDIHIVPLGDREYWVGATVEFPTATGNISAEAAQLDTVMQGAIAICPALRMATPVHQWSGLRPRPWNRSAPIIELLTGYTNVILATGHYRNGVLLAPATAQRVCEILTAAAASESH